MERFRPDRSSVGTSPTPSSTSKAIKLSLAQPWTFTVYSPRPKTSS